MIKRVIIALISSTLWICPAHAGVGHTIKNGGGDAELELVKVWGTLVQTLSICLHREAPCELTDVEREQLGTLIEVRKRTPHIKFEKNELLYDADGRPKSRAEILAVAVETLQALVCEKQLIAPALDALKLASQIEAIEHFHVFPMPAGDFIVKSVNKNLTVSKGEKSVNLSAMIESRIGEAINDIRYIRSEFKRSKIEVRANINGSQFMALVDVSLDPKLTALFLQ